MILLRNGTIFDGTGKQAARGDVLIAGDRIAEVGVFPGPAEARVIDCGGLAISPGFIDAHSHSDLQVLENRPEKALQGVTTEVVGNCGFSPYPVPQDRRLLHQFANGIFRGDDQWGWRSAAEYLADVKRSAKLASVVSLVGHGSLRIAEASHRLGALAPDEVAAMERMLDEALEQGASGFSTGLMYSPGESAPLEELEQLCRVVARRGGIYTSHIRNYTTKLVEAVDEQIGLARRTGCRLQISHLQAVGPANWPKQAQAIERIERAREEGIEIGFDCYPYVAGSTVLTQFLPQWALAGGIGGLLLRLRDRGERSRIAAQTVADLAQRWSDLYISAVGSAAHRGLVGKNLAEIGEARGREPVEAALDLLLEERGEVTILEFNQSEDNLRTLLTHPLANVVSDGFYVKGRPHPRLHGTFPYLLGEICRKRGWMPLAEGVRKITDLPARRFGIAQRGRIERGWFADLTVFDAGKIASAASYENPEVAPTGIRYVFRNGNAVLAAMP
jgi:N-acyl-D-amino-acid deacylase